MMSAGLARSSAAASNSSGCAAPVSPSTVHNVSRICFLGSSPTALAPPTMARRNVGLLQSPFDDRCHEARVPELVFKRAGKLVQVILLVGAPCPEKFLADAE